MIVGVLLLYTVGVCSSDSSSAVSPCVSTHEVSCFSLTDCKKSPGPVEVEAGKKLVIVLEDGQSTCHWIQGQVHILNGSQTITLESLSETDSGEYTLRCEAQNGTISSTNVSLVVTSECPSKPQLILKDMGPWSAPKFKCITKGFPKPTIKWSSNKAEYDRLTDDGSVESVISSLKFFQRGAMCCAFNTAGEECTQLYDFDLRNRKNISHSVILSPGQSLLLRCNTDNNPKWQKDNITIDSDSFPCSLDRNKMCIIKETHRIKMVYLSIPSLTHDDSVSYTCRSQNIMVTLNVSVQADGFLDVKLEESKIIPIENISSSCLQANITYHPSLENCIWETPDKNKTKCRTEPWVTKHRTVRLCDQLKTGEYKLHIKAGGQKKTQTVSLCVAEPPEIKMPVFKDNNTYFITTQSLVPASYTWMSCSNDSSMDDCWTDITQTSKTDSSVSCKKMIQSSLNRDLVSGGFLRFCLSNSIGHWCGPTVHVPPPLLRSTGLPHKNEFSTMFLKTGSIVLLLALIVVTILLLYFIKKKKPKYEPQLQMIQMVGPNDNDYIYINFKDFTYDSKWEFPRENLELGKELGSGAFGMVLQATAYGINKPGISQQVAVKMLKEKHQAVEREALMSELKMLTHIGQHSNIVNLLGACTETGPIYLIFQYCCYGDLLNYLKNNSQRYHKSVTDAFNKDRFSSLYHNLHPSKAAREPQTTVDYYMPMYGSTTRGQESIALLTLNSGDRDCYEDPDMVEILDEKDEDLQALTYDDLLSFAYQVARGMEFLSSKNCIHRDLAARNVLVTKGRLAKIGDFGLARDIDNDSNSVVRGNVRLPVKWMAPESIFQGVYTMKSDVWGYGILLWEIFSLGVTPYPGMKVDQNFYSMIERGFQMECPYYANESVYEIMCKCWELESCDRPSFSELVSFMAAQLTEIEEKLYHNMLDSNSSEYQNMTSVLGISALTKQNETKTGNNYCPAYATEESEVKVCISNTIEGDGGLKKTDGVE